MLNCPHLSVRVLLPILRAGHHVVGREVASQPHQLPGLEHAEVPVQLADIHPEFKVHIEH